MNPPSGDENSNVEPSCVRSLEFKRSENINSNSLSLMEKIKIESENSNNKLQFQ